MSLKGCVSLKGSPIKGISIRTEVKPAEDRTASLYLLGRVSGLLDGSMLKGNQDEKLLGMYMDEGIDFVRRLEGYYLIILVDRKDKAVYFINNRYSNTKLYYSNEGDRMLFSSGFHDLIKSRQVKKPNMKVVNLFLNSGYSYSRETFIEGIRVLVPGHYLKVQGGIEEICYSRMSFERKPFKDQKKAQEEYLNLWKSEISRFVKANKIKEIGAALSGGVDTSFLVLSASLAHDKPINTYTAEYDYSLFNEGRKAEYVTKVCNGKHHIVKIGSDALDLMPEMIYVSQEPVLASSLSLYLIMKEASEVSDVFLTGDGGNNIFNHLYPVCELHRYLKDVPYPLRRFFYDSVDAVAGLTSSERLWELKYPLHAFRNRDIYRNFYRELTCYRHFSGKERRKLFRKGLYDELDELDDPSLVRLTKDDFCNSLIEARFLHGSMQYVSGFHERFADHLGIHLFPVYQNMKIINFLNSLPFDQLNEGNTFKLLTNKALRMPFQKKILQEHFGHEHAYGCGQPFDQPFHGWFMEKPEVVEALFKRLRNRGWYDDKYLGSLFREHRRQKMHSHIYCQLKNHAYRIMALLSLELWCMQILDGIGYKETLYGTLRS